MKNTENTFRKGDIFLTHFPFTNMTRSKIRPVVVLGGVSAYNDVMVMAISSVPERRDNASVVYISSRHPQFHHTGLKKDSVIIVNRIATIRKDRLFKKLGALSSDDLNQIDCLLLERFAFGGNRHISSDLIPYGKQSVNADDIFYVVKTLRSDFLTQGQKVPAFEKTVADYCGAGYAVAVNSGTSALHIACLALGLGPGDILWTSPITFVASANCALYCGANVDFVDIDPRTYNMSVDALAVKLEKAKAAGTLPKVVVPVHLCGQPCDMAAIHAMSQEFGFRIIEDACHAIGGKYKTDPIGSCRYSDITIFSFHPVKVITSGEGGMAVTNGPDLAQKMILFRSHGITRDPGRLSKTDPPAYYYEQVALGFNYRMTDIHAALGLSQMNRLDTFVARRVHLAKRYDALLTDLPVTTPWQHPDGVSAWHIYVIRLQMEKIAATHRQVFESLRDNGIGVNLHYIPVHTQPWYRQLGFEPGMFPESETYFQETLTLPLFPAMTEDEQDRVVDCLNKAIKR